jgi:deoxyribodipyrimidine photo-lyase
VEQGVNEARVTLLKAGVERCGPIVLWMSRDQRVRDNWALLFARDLARSLKVPLAVVFCLAPAFLGATIRQYAFMLRGLEEVEQRLLRLGIPFFLLDGDPGREAARFAERHRAAAMVTDFDPLRIKRAWQAAAARLLAVPFFEVDSHNIVPCRAASPKREYGAYTLRPKLRRLLPEFLDPFPVLKRHPYRWKGKVPAVNWKRFLASLRADRGVPETDRPGPGEDAAMRCLRRFIANSLPRYDSRRSDPAQDGQSGLSPYLHFGQLAAQRVALEVMRSTVPELAREAFLEELITRRELSDNFCLYAPDYDSTACFPDWAKRTLEKHRKDRREHLYTLREFEAGRTHDPLWNAAQLEMVASGRMHGYLRMYWAKKILEWTPSPDEAMRIAIRLNDRYGLDGRDPNGYAGIAWSIGGVHDRPWGERKVFGMVRSMSYNGCRSKFDVDEYIRRVEKITVRASRGRG